MKKGTDDGFTLIEFLISLCIVGIFFSFASPTFVRAKDTAREKELRANLHKIQIGLERYAVDFGQYPKMIWGGDKQGWSRQKGVGCRTMWEHEAFNGKNEDTAAPPFDPLIYYDYLESYPTNPFMKRGMGLQTTIAWTAPVDCKPGDGDPRFGFNGEKMGNILEDPRYLWTGPGKVSRVKNCFLSEAKKNYVAMVDKRMFCNPFYAMGGLPEYPDASSIEDLTKKLKSVTDNHPELCKTRSAFWPGEFFYRAGGPYDLPLEYISYNLPDPHFVYVWDFKYLKLNKYMLGGFGPLNVEGEDVIRMTNVDGCIINNIDGYSKDQYYQYNQLLYRTKLSPIHFSSPEVFGGGEYMKMPYFPYYRDNNNWIYGAPDGFKDGVVCILYPDPYHPVS